MNISLDFMVVPQPDGKVAVFAPGALAAGTFAANPSFITVSGAGFPTPPKGAVTQQEFQDWVAGLRSQGFQVTNK